MKRLAQYFMNSRPTFGYNDWPVFVYYRFIKTRMLTSIVSHLFTLY